MRVTIPTPAAIASTLFWFLGVFFILITLSLGIPAMSAAAPLGMRIIALILAIFSVAYCVGGIALRGWKWGVRWWGSALCIVGGLLSIVLNRQASLALAILNIVALVLIVISWKGVKPLTNQQ